MRFLAALELLQREATDEMRVHGIGVELYRFAEEKLRAVELPVLSIKNPQPIERIKVARVVAQDRLIELGGACVIAVAMQSPRLHHQRVVGRHTLLRASNGKSRWRDAALRTLPNLRI